MLKIKERRESTDTLTVKRSKHIHKKSKDLRLKAEAGPAANVYDFLEQCSDVHKVLLKSQQILNDCMREIQDMDAQIEGAQNDRTVDALTVDLDAGDNFAGVDHKFMFNELDEECNALLAGVQAFKSGGVDFGSLFTKVGHEFAGGEARRLH